MQLLRFRRKLGVAPMQQAQIREPERMLLDRYVVQPATARGIALPGLPCREEVESEAEPRLENDEVLAPRPALGQAVALEKHMLGLRDAAVGAVVHVAERGGVGRVVAEIELRRDKRWHGASIIDAPARGVNEQARRTEARHRSRLDPWQTGDAAEPPWRSVQPRHRPGHEAGGVC